MEGIASFTKRFGLSSLFILLFIGYAFAESSTGNISTVTEEKFAWSESTGWINARPNNGGMTVHSNYLSGYIWGENIGWIQLGSSNGGPYTNSASSDDWGVNLDVNGNLTGFAWGENIGWIDFNPMYSQVTFSM